MTAGALYLLPAPLAEGTALDVLPAATLAAAHRIEYFLAENAKSTRAFLKSISHPRPIQALRIVEIGHHPEPAAVADWLRPILEGDDAAIVSEAGCPGVADPGATIVAQAHQLGVRVFPLVGPSSILLALMASGLNGQSFRFIGYLPQDAAALSTRLREVERESRSGETQVWIETPYRNERMVDAVLAACVADTRLTLATDLTADTAQVRTRTVAEWKAMARADRPAQDRHPTVFALLATPSSRRAR
jgi:16S rRNA (cytidine1402-2'-O)-methyltransferase